MRKIFSFFILSTLLINFAKAQYVTLDCNGFSLNGNAFKPLVINYMIDFANKNSAYNSFYPSPLWNYSGKYGLPNTGLPPNTIWAPFPWSQRWIYSTTAEEAVATQKLDQDFNRIKNSLQFNTIRVFVERDRASASNGGSFNYKTGNINYYFSVLDQLLAKLNTYGLKAILVLGNKTDWQDYDGYATFIADVANRYKNNPAILAYDLYNEPFYRGGLNNNLNDKYLTANWVSEWYYTIKSKDPNHLITLGYDASEVVLNWDPMMAPLDFSSFHFYPLTDNISTGTKAIASRLYWASRTMAKPWIIGETGYSGTDITSINSADPLVGTELEQYRYARETLTKSIDCGCKGYSWWMYQEVNWGNNFDDRLGLIKKFDENNTGADFLTEVDKDVATAFTDYSTLVPNVSLCTRPTGSDGNYYNFFPNTNNIHLLTGYVKDENNNPLANAYVGITVNQQWGNIKWSYTNSAGEFRIYGNSPASSLDDIHISLPGYNVTKKVWPNIAQNQTHVITKVNYNKWTKKQTNDYNNYISGWQITDWDKFYNADFDGDGEDELLCMQNHGVANDWTTLLTYNNSQANWQQLWTNGGNDWIGPWHHETQYGDRFITGDFDGNGTGDELLCMQVTSTNSDWCSLLKYSSGGWSYATTNSTNIGNDYIGPWKINTTDEFKVGDFNNDGKDDLFCVRKTSGTNDLFSILNFNPSNGTWNYLYLGGQPMTNWNGEWIGGWPINPTDKYYIGDYDGNGTDDILFAQCTSGSTDWITLQTISPTTGAFSSLWSNSGSNSVAIYPYRNNLIIGNYDEDINTEIMGFATQAAKFDFSANQFSSEWSTGTSLRFSDWYVISQTPNYAFIKTHKWSPEQLMVFRKYGSNYLVNMYSYNRTDDCPITNPNGIMPNDNDLKQFSPEISDLNVYPNPTYGDLTIVVNQDSYDNSLINIFNIQGQIVKTINMNGFEAGIQQMNITMDDLSTGFYFINFTNNKNSLTKKVSYIK